MPLPLKIRHFYTRLRYRRIKDFFRLMFISQRKLLICLILVFLLLYFMFHNQHEKACNISKEVTENLYRDAGSVGELLKSLKLNYFLCYGSLWGALYINRILPWDTNVDFCVTNEEISKLDQAYLIRLFKSKKMDIGYNNKDGMYRISSQSSSAGHIHLILFEEDSRTGKMRRVGWKNRVTPPDMCEAIHCFPPRLIMHPLPLIKLGNMEVPVPREEIEMLKYLYPDDWWKELRAKDC